MTTENTALTVHARAAVALGSSKAETDLLELAAKSKSITAITNKDGRTECHAAAMTAKEARINIEKAGKSAREDATAFSKAVIAEEARLVALIKPEETRLIDLRDEFDAKVKAEKEAAEALERQRIEAIKARIAEFSGMVTDSAMLEAHGAAQELDVALSVDIDDSFGEFYGDAVEAKAAAVAKLRDIVAAKQRSEQEAARVKEDQEAELARLAEESRRQAEERARMDAERAELDRQRKELAEAKSEQDRIAAAKAAAEKAEQDRIHAEEIRKLDAERRAAQAQAAAEALAALPKVEEATCNESLQVADVAIKSKVLPDDKTGPRVTSLRIQIAAELDKMTVYDLSNVLAYCQALPIRNMLAA